MEVCSILEACIRSTVDYQHIFTSQRDYERSGILLGVPVPCSLEALASFPNVIELMLVYLCDLLFSIRSLSESTTGCQMSDCLRQGLDCHWERGFSDLGHLGDGSGGFTVRISSLECLGGVPPGICSIVRFLALLPAFGFSCECIARIPKLLVKFEGIGSLLIEITGFLEFRR